MSNDMKISNICIYLATYILLNMCYKRMFNLTKPYFKHLSTNKSKIIYSVEIYLNL